MQKYILETEKYNICKKSLSKVEAFLSSNKNFLFIKGDVGSGKSLIAYKTFVKFENKSKFLYLKKREEDLCYTESFGNYQYRYKRTIAFLSVQRFAREYLESFITRTSPPCYSSIDVLILDDLGRENTTAKINQFIAETLASRYDNNLKTIITSNICKEDYLTERYGDYILSRLKRAGSSLTIEDFKLK